MSSLAYKRETLGALGSLRTDQLTKRSEELVIPVTDSGMNSI